jgi:GrpB-like predicted nucleotidyltransferase (UPF0157 family)
MLPPYAVRLIPHDPAWADQASEEEARILKSVWPAVIEMHHVGSTSIPGIKAKPIIDLVAVSPSLEVIESARPQLEALGYAWHGEYGVEGRRFCTLSDPKTGLRRFHLIAMPTATSASAATSPSAIISAPARRWPRPISR